MNLFYTPENQVQESLIRVEGQEARHISRVMRYREGDELFITNGAGTLFRCNILAVSDKLVEAEVQESKTEEEPQPRVTVCLGIIKKRDRLEFALEKITELGVNRIILFRGEYTEKGKVRVDRAEASVLAAMKQSLRVYLPEITVTDSLEKAINSITEPSALVFADEKSNTGTTISPTATHLVLIVGPEGGVSDNERAFLKKQGAIHYSLGDKRLRAETAAIVMADRFCSGRSS